MAKFPSIWHQMRLSVICATKLGAHYMPRLCTSATNMNETPPITISYMNRKEEPKPDNVIGTETRKGKVSFSGDKKIIDSL